jgi:uncharacterized protein
MSRIQGAGLNSSYRNFSSKLTFFLTLCLAVVSTNALLAASFDCAKARSRVEKAICGDPELSKMDEQLAAAYKAALVAHPLPSYVRARQRDWLTVLPHLDSQHFLNKLKEEYGIRINQLKTADKVIAYSNAEATFSYGGGDAVAELWQQSDGKWHLSIWGGFHFDPIASQANGYETFEGCEFEGTVQEPFKPDGANSASNKDGQRVTFLLKGATFGFGGNDPGVCYGRGLIVADELMRVTNQSK